MTHFCRKTCRLTGMSAGGLSFCLLYGIVLVHCQIVEYHYINLHKSWKDARQHCRDHYTDLATVQSIQDAHRVPIPTNILDWAWIGLFDDPVSWRGTMTADSNSWKWSATGTQSPGGFQNWATGEPNNLFGREHCVFIDNVLGWKDYHCTGAVKFICYTVNSSGIKEYFLINTALNWAGAQAHCRENYQDLALIETPAESQTVLDLISNPPTPAWIGLSRQPRRWSDGNPSTYTNWLPGQPDGAGDCFVLRSDYYWDDANCAIQKQFVCQQALKLRVQAKITLKTTADLTDPAIKNMFFKVLGDILEDDGVSPRWIFPARWATLSLLKAMV